jgi:hypothetical protein
MSRSHFRTGEVPSGAGHSRISDTTGGTHKAPMLPGCITHTIAGREKEHGTIDGHVRNTLPFSLNNYGKNVVHKTDTPAPKTAARKTDLGGYTYPGAGIIHS